MITIDATAAPPAARRLNGRALLGRRSFLALSAATASVLLAGCGQDNAPDMTAAAVQRLQDDYARSLFSAFRRRNRGLLRRIETGLLLQRDLATFALADRLDQPRAADEYTFPHSTGHPVAGAGSDDRQRLVTVGDYSNTVEGWQNLGLYVRDDPSARWQRAFSGGLYTADVPDFSTRPVPVVDPAATDYAATPHSVPSLVARALQDPGSGDAGRFTASDVRQRYADDLAQQTRSAASIGTVSRQYRPGELIIALGIAGGCLVLGSFTFTQTIVAAPGKHVSFKSDTPQHHAYPSRYARTTSAFTALFAATVPSGGKLTLISAEERQTDLSAS